MATTDPTTATVRGYFEALRAGDAARLAHHTLPHPELATLVASPPVPTAARHLAALDALSVRTAELPRDRLLVQAWLGEHVQLLVMQATAAGYRIDARYPIAALRPDDGPRTTARAFYRGLLAGDVAAMQTLAFDARGVELLANGGLAPVDAWHHELLVEMLVLCELEAGDPFEVPTGTQFVGPRHHELGIRVLQALTPEGEIPFLLRQRDGDWKVIPFHFIQAVAMRRGATFGTA
jgi:hypothetical protein